ncbi:RHS repeat-associated core domain-containing protein [Rhizobacter sp. OV335]|uniref:RHS repeat-associated core domain-containing protein n=1 Tax=Rhizobacter sp. OV335 TaxID=1500264 RepID=UPI001356627A|nr:RHS repeat-associated core domain-containing protein [Rhizobacter sp. OV335]
MTQAQTAGQPVTRTVTYEYDAYGTPVKQTVEPDDARYTVTTVMEPDANYGVTRKRTVTWRDPVTGETRTRSDGSDYDSRFRYAEKSTNAKGHETTSTHDAGSGNVLSTTDPDRLTARWQYDGWGRKLRESRADGTATSTAYRQCADSCLNGAATVTITQQWGGANEASQTTSPSETFEDAAGHEVLSRHWGFDGTAVLSEKVYDAQGRVQRLSRPYATGQSAVWTSYDRDALGRVWQINAPTKTGSGVDSASFSYNGLSRTSLNAKGQARTEVRNAAGQLASVTDAYGATTRYVYGAFGSLARTIDPKGNRIEIGYDRLGRKTTLDDPNLGHWTYVVDPLGQTRQQTDSKQQTTSFEFDVLGRMTRRLEPDLDSRWEYDTAANGTGELAETYTWAANAKDYRRVLSYDAVGRPSSTVTSLDADYASKVTYDAFGRPDRTTQSRAARGAGVTATAAGNSFQQHYNALGYVDRIDRYEGTSTTAITLWTAQSMDAEGRLTQEQLGNGMVTRRGYNPYTGRLNSIRSGVSAADAQYQNDGYDYDVLGNLESRSQLMVNGGATLNESFTYDSLNRLYTSAIGSSVKTTTYDELGNLTSKTGVGLYRYPPSGAGSIGPNAVSVVQGTVAGLTNPGFGYEVNGNLKTGLGRSYAWTSYDMPSSIDKLDGANAVQRTAFLYGPDHARTRQTISPMSAGVAGSATTTIWYGGAVEKEIDTAANTTTIRTMLPAQLGFIEEKFSGTAIAPTAVATRNLRYFLTDHLGSTLAEMDQAQSVLQRMSYDAWGRRRNADGSDDSGPQWGNLKNTQDHSGYTGHEHLDQLGLVNMNARMYDPLLGRHTSADPTVPDPTNAQAFNRYSYVLNNALAFTDPSGLDPIRINTTSDSICLGKPDCRVKFESAADDNETKTEGGKTGVAVNDGGTTKPQTSNESSTTSPASSGTPTQSQQQAPTDLGPAIQKINRQFTDAMEAGDVAKMQQLFQQYLELKGDDPSSGPNKVRMGFAIVTVAGRQGTNDLSTLAPMASAALGSGMIGVGVTVPKAGSAAAVNAPVWSSTKKLSSVENALGHWNKHKSEFPELNNSKQYVEAARSLAAKPPATALTKGRGAETLIYDRATNTFLVKGTDGAPKTMFRPTDGINYWNKQ